MKGRKQEQEHTADQTSPRTQQLEMAGSYILALTGERSAPEARQFVKRTSHQNLRFRDRSGKRNIVLISKD